MNLTEKNNVIPLPKEREVIAILGNDNEVSSYIVKPKIKHFGVNWLMIYQDTLEWLATEHIPYEQIRVFMYLMSKLDFENYIRITQASIAEALKMKTSNVSRAVRGLISRSIIIEGPHAGLAKTYRLNPHMAYKGKNPKNTIIEFDSLVKARERNERNERKASEDTLQPVS